MKLDVYRRCTRREKMEVLSAFWRRHGDAPPAILEAARQYGAYAVLCVAAICLELIVVIVAGFSHALVVGWLALAVEVFTLWSLWWSVLRYRALRARD
ncbi:MAG TPA: hypothetical protein PLG60_03555 [Acidimicrobiales bacterium]|nr:MAG: hypothetical protein B7X07_01890 [Actinobacteria bacterium 21-64-8]HQT99559.1 hypothetical protein [Acidimicrobiales bacterium]